MTCQTTNSSPPRFESSTLGSNMQSQTKNKSFILVNDQISGHFHLMSTLIRILVGVMHNCMTRSTNANVGLQENSKRALTRKLTAGKSIMQVFCKPPSSGHFTHTNPMKVTAYSVVHQTSTNKTKRPALSPKTRPNNAFCMLHSDHDAGERFPAVLASTHHLECLPVHPSLFFRGL
jgi:hypothetical protein